MKQYVHGYSERENTRLFDQATTLTDLLHHDTRYPAGSRVLEAGCGVGAQTVALAANSPQAHFTSVDISPTSLAQAQQRVEEALLTNVSFQQADIFDSPFPADCFDHIFLCFVLEHLPEPERALACLRTCLKPRGTLTVIEGDHGSTFFYPESVAGQQTIDCLVQAQAQVGGNALIGRQLFPLLTQAGWHQVAVSPRVVYVDAGRPDLVEGFTKNTFIAMVEGVKEQALSLGLIDSATWDQGVRDLYRTTEPDGIFYYTFFKAVGVK